MELRDVVESIEAKFPGKISNVVVQPRRIYLDVDISVFRDVFTHVKKELGVYFLAAITGLDLENKFGVFYHFQVSNAGLISFRVPVPKDKPVIKSIVDIIPGALLYEMEVHDLFGVIFEGNPWMDRKLVLPDDWPEGVYPLRKDISIDDLKKILANRGDG